MIAGILNGYIGLLILLFIVAIIVIAIATMRARNAGRKVVSGNEPISDTSRRNYHTRLDKDEEEESYEARRDNPDYRSARSRNDTL